LRLSCKKVKAIVDGTVTDVALEADALDAKAVIGTFLNFIFTGMGI
jgi:hypothetical protein